MSDRSQVPLDRIIELAAGRLPAEEALRLRAQIADDPRAAADLAWYEETIALARDTTAEDAPEHLIQRALRISRPVRPPATPPLLRRVIATLLTDSAQAAPAFGVRSAPLATRQLLFRAGDRNVIVLIAAVQADWQVSGQVLGPEESGRVELRGTKPTLSAALNAVSEFTLPLVSAGRYTLVLQQGGFEVVVPELEVGVIFATNLSELVEQLAVATPDGQGQLLAEHAGQRTLALANALKDACLEAWSGAPARTIAAAGALRLLAEQLDDAEAWALAGWADGLVDLAEGQMERAAVQFEQARAGFVALGQPQNAASTQVSMMVPLAMLGRYEEALACGLAAHAVFIAQGEELAAGKIELNLGNIHFRRDQYSEAEQWYRAASARSAAIGATTLAVMADTGLADVLTWQYHFRQAEQIYGRALLHAEEVGAAALKALIECDLGWLALARGRYDQALEFLERSRRDYLALEMSFDVAIVELKLADAYLEVNLVPEALAIYDRLVRSFAELGMRFEQGWVGIQQGRALMSLQRMPEARRSLAEAHELFEAEGNSVCAALAALFAAQLDHAAGAYQAVAAAAPALQAIFVAARSWGWALLVGWLHGDALRRLAQPQAAQTLLEQVFHEAEARVLPQIAWRCAVSLGLLDAEPQRAEQWLRRAVELIERLRAPLPAEEFRTAFAADKLTPYIELARICLDDGRPERLATALLYVERARSRALLDLLVGVLPALPRSHDQFEAGLLDQLLELREELNWFYNQRNRPPDDGGPPRPARIDELEAEISTRESAVATITRQLQQTGGSSALRDATLYQSEPLDIARLQQDLGAATLLVEYADINGELVAWLVSGAGVEVVRELGDLKTVTESLRQLSFQITTMRHGGEQLRAHEAQLVRRTQHHLGLLYTLLIKPIERRLHVERLVIVPHGPLHYVPFHALFDGTAHLIERYEVCVAPSAAVLQRCLAQPFPGWQRALLVGVPDERAPFVRDEVQHLAQLFPEATVLVDDQAVLPAVRAHAPEANLVHLACHGQFRSDNPLFSALRLADGWLTVRDAYSLSLSCGLVTLSACETGVQTVAPGDELMGLARGFFSAGAPALLVSLWTVDDVTTALFMEQFYSRLLAGDRPAAAVRSAQGHMLRSHPHPYFWAPFVLLGRW